MLDVLLRADTAADETTECRADDKLSDANTGKDGDDTKHAEELKDHHERIREPVDGNTDTSLADEAASQGPAERHVEDLTYDSEANRLAGITDRDATDDEEHRDSDAAENDAGENDTERGKQQLNDSVLERDERQNAAVGEEGSKRYHNGTELANGSRIVDSNDHVHSCELTAGNDSVDDRVCSEECRKDESCTEDAEAKPGLEPIDRNCEESNDVDRPAEDVDKDWSERSADANTERTDYEKSKKIIDEKEYAKLSNECDERVAERDAASSEPEFGSNCRDDDAKQDESESLAETGNNEDISNVPVREEESKGSQDAAAIVSATNVEVEDDAMSRHQSYVTVKDAGRSDSDEDDQEDAAELNTSTDHNREHDQLTEVRRDKEADSEAGADELTAAGETSSGITTASYSEDQQMTEPETEQPSVKERCSFENDCNPTDNRDSSKEIQPNSTEVQIVRNSNDNDRGFTQIEDKVTEENPSSVDVKTRHECNSAEYGERSEQVTVTSTTTSGSVVEPLVSPQTTCVNDVGDVVTDKKHDGKPAETTDEERNETVTEASKISTAVAAPDNMRDASEASESEVQTQKLMSSRADEQDVPPSSLSDSK